MFGFLQGTSHDDDDVNMAGQAEHNLREPAGQIPIESAGGVTNCSDGNLVSLHLNGDHSAATKPPSAVDALNHPGQTDVESAMPEISISSVSFSSSQNEDLASEAVSVLIIFYFSFIPHVKSLHSADHPEFSEKQFSSQQSPQFIPKSLEAVSADSTLLDLDANEATQTDNSQMTQIIETQPEHLPELALSSTQPSISSATAPEDRSAPSSTKTEKGPKTPSANRLSISYARGNRRLVLDAEVVESLKLYRQEGRIDVVIKLAEDGDERLKGILVR
jgi:20S proteasome subunit alpha 6